MAFCRGDPGYDLDSAIFRHMRVPVDGMGYVKAYLSLFEGGTVYLSRNVGDMVNILADDDVIAHHTRIPLYLA